MSRKLDQELLEAVAEKGGDSHAVETPVTLGASARSGPKNKKGVGLLVTLLAMAGAVVALFMVGFKDAAVYAMTVDKLASEKASFIGRKVRVEGELVPGTLVKRDQPCEYRFTLHKDATQLPVRYAQCVIPDTFRDMPGGGVQVTVEGALGPKGDFEASLVMAKCASKYDPATHKMNPNPAL